MIIKKIWSLSLFISLMLPLHSMQLQLQEEGAVPTLGALALGAVVGKTIPQTFYQKLIESNYNFAASRMGIENEILQKLPEEPRKCIKALFCKKYGDSDISLAETSDESRRMANRFDRILFKKALTEAFIVSNINALNQLFASEHIVEFFTASEIEKLKKYYSSGQFPSLKNLCLKTVAEEAVPLAFEQKLEESKYDYDQSRKWIDVILSSISNGINDEHERRIKEFYCKKYDCEKYAYFVFHRKLKDYNILPVFSPDGTKIVSGSADKTIKIWDVATGKCNHVFSGHKDHLTSVIFSPDGNIVASGSWDKTIRLWDTATGKCNYVLEGHDDTITSVVFLPNGNTIASGSWDKTIRLWDTATGKCNYVLEGHDDGIHSVVLSPDGTKIASRSSDRTIRLWDTATGTCNRKLRDYDHTHNNSIVVFSPDGTKIAARSSADETIRIWDTATGTCNRKLKGSIFFCSDMLHSIVFSPDGTKIAAGSNDGDVMIWDILKGRYDQIIPGRYDHALRGHRDRVYSVTFFSDGEKIASGSSDKTVRIWNTSTRKCHQVLRGHDNRIYSVVHSPDGNIMASGSSEGVRLWKKQDFYQVLFKRSLIKCAEENNTEALKRLFYDAEVDKLIEREALEDLKETVSNEYSIPRENLAMPFYSRMMQRCKRVFSKVKEVINLKNHIEQSSDVRWPHFNRIRRGIEMLAMKFVAAMRHLRFWYR